MGVVLGGGRVDGVVGEAWWVMPQEEDGLGRRGSDGEREREGARKSWTWTWTWTWTREKKKRRHVLRGRK